MSEQDFNLALDDCIDRVNRGEPIEACLTAYPLHAAELEPLLKAVKETQKAFAFTPSTEAKRTAREQFYSAMDKQNHPSFWSRLASRSVVLSAIAAVLVIAGAAFFALRTSVFQEPIETVTVSSPSANGNFAFLVSDEVNAISEFSNLYVTIDKVGLLQTGNDSRWIEFAPETKEFDLTLLPGDVSQQLWRGDVPEGAYSKVVIYVSTITGILKTTGEQIDIKLPSNKLQLEIPFQIVSGQNTAFTYDLTVIKTGGDRNSKYLLKPQIGESGTGRPAIPVTPTHNQTPAGPPATETPVPPTHNQPALQPPQLPEKAKGNPQQ